MRAIWNRKEGADAPKVDDVVKGVMKPSKNGTRFSLDKQEGTEYLIKSVEEDTPWSNDHGTFQPYICEFASMEGFEPIDKPSEDAIPLGRAKEFDHTRDSIERQTALKVAGELTKALIEKGVVEDALAAGHNLHVLTDEGAKAIQGE